MTFSEYIESESLLIHTENMVKDNENVRINAKAEYLQAYI